MITNPETGENEILRDCWTGIHDQDWDQSDFNGYPYVEKGGPKIRTKSEVFAQAGNRMSFKITNFKGEIDWVKAFEDNVFNPLPAEDGTKRDNWMFHPTSILTIDLNFYNYVTGIIMDTKIIIHRTESGLITV